jgi:hypothetical protein
VGAIVVDSDELRRLARQLQLAADYATETAASVQGGIHFGDLALAAALDPAGAAMFEAAVLEVVAGPFALGTIETDLAGLAASLGQAAEDYLEADLEARAELLVGPDIQLVFRLAALSPPDRTPTVVAVGPAAGIDETPPRDLTDLISHLAALNDTRRSGQGEIDIQTLTGVDASGQPVRKIVVYLPGVDDWDPLDRSDVNDAVNAARPIEGESSTYEYGVLAALHQAGVTAGDDVTIVGHSQGGAVAVDLARDASRSGQFNVTHVITAGAPIAIALRGLPSSTKVLALENRDDVVPRLDDAPNPTRANVTTVTVDQPNGSIGGNHDVAKSYLPGAAAAEARDPKVQSYLRSESGLTNIDHSSTTRYSITSG